MNKDWIRKKLWLSLLPCSRLSQENLADKTGTHCRLFKAVQERTRSTVLQLNCQGFARLLKEGLRSRQRHGNTCDCFWRCKKMPCLQLGKMTGKAGKASWNGHEKTSSPGWAVVSGPGDDSSLPALSLGTFRARSPWQPLVEKVYVKVYKDESRMYEIAMTLPYSAIRCRCKKQAAGPGCVLTRGQTTSSIQAELHPRECTYQPLVAVTACDNVTSTLWSNVDVFHIGFLTTSYICNIVASNKNVFWKHFSSFLCFFCRSNARLDSGTCTFTRVWPFPSSAFWYPGSTLVFILYYFVIHCSPVAPCSAQKPHHAHFMPLEISAGFWWTLHVQKRYDVHSFVSFTQRVCNTKMVYTFFAHGRLNNVWTRLNDVVISISQAQIETEVHWKFLFEFLQGDWSRTFCWPARLFLSYKLLVSVCHLPNSARSSLQAGTTFSQLVLESRLLHVWSQDSYNTYLEKGKTPEEDIAKSETRKLQESSRPEGMQMFFCDFSHLSMLFFILPVVASSNHVHDVKLSKQVYDSARMDILDATLSSFKLSKMPQAACYRAWHFYIKVSCCLRLRWGRHKKRRRRMLSGLTATVSK